MVKVDKYNGFDNRISHGNWEIDVTLKGERTKQSAKPEDRERRNVADP